MFDVFLSYSRADQEAVETVALGLRDQGLSPFLDRWHLAAGQPWQDLLATRLDDCRSVAIFIGPGEMGSWQRREKAYALNRQAEQAGFPVIPVLLPGVDDPALDFLGLNTWIDLRAGGIKPENLSDLIAAINGEPPGEQSSGNDPRAAICPYRGLQPFREEDAAFFFGREAFTETLVDKIATRRFIAVAGASGSGKSSVVRAGLVPHLRADNERGGWDILTILPGARPLDALVQAFDPPGPDLGRIDRIKAIAGRAESLRDGTISLTQLTKSLLTDQPGTDRLLLVVDQFEELYTLVATQDAADRERFIDLLLEATEGSGELHVVLTIRGDFFAKALSRRDLADCLQDSVVNIGPLSTLGVPMSELESVIRKPADSVGLSFEDGLVERILSDVGTEPGNLPLLEFLLTELWRDRHNGQLTNAAYTELGGVEGAIAARADAALSVLSPEQLEDAKRLMLMLVRPGEGQEDTRARAGMPEDAGLKELVQRFAKADTRLLVTGEDVTLGQTVEVSHEALIRNWAQLRVWVDENRDLLRIRERIRERMLRWKASEQAKDLLLPVGLDLEEGVSLIENSDAVPIEDVVGYIEASVKSRDEALARLQKERDEEQERKLRAQRQRRNLFAGAFAISIVLLGIAAWQWRTADLATARAEFQASRVMGTWFKTQAEFPDEATVTLIEGINFLGFHIAENLPVPREVIEGMQAVIRAVGYSVPEMHVLNAHKDDVTSVVYSPDGTRLMTAGDDGFSRLWDTKTHKLIHESPRDDFGVPPLTNGTFSPDGKRAVLAVNDGPAVVVNAKSGEVIQTLEGHRDEVLLAKFSRDGKHILTTGSTGDGQVIVRDAETYEIQMRFQDRGAVLFADISPNGRYLASGGQRQVLLIWKILPSVKEYGFETGDISYEFGIGDWVYTGAFSPSGNMVIAAQEDGDGALWHIYDKREVGYGAGAKRLDSASFSGRHLVMGDELINIGSNPPKLTLKLPRTGGNSTNFSTLSTDGNYILSTVTADSVARVWDAKTGRRVATLEGHAKGAKGAVISAAFHPRRRVLRVATAGRDGTVRFWDLHPEPNFEKLPDNEAVDPLTAQAVLKKACALLERRPVDAGWPCADPPASQR